MRRELRLLAATTDKAKTRDCTDSAFSAFRRRSLPTFASIAAGVPMRTLAGRKRLQGLKPEKGGSSVLSRVLAHALQSVAANGSQFPPSIRLSRLALELIALSHRRAHRHLPMRCARAWRRVRR